MNELKILLLEDSPDDAALIERRLQKENLSFTLKVVETRKEYENILTEFEPQVVISDHTLPQFNSLEALKIFKAYKSKDNPEAVFILVTGTVSEEFAVEVIKKGADDYILKDRLQRLPAAVVNSLEKNRLQEEKRKAEEEKLQLLEVLQKSLNQIFIFNSDTLKFKYANAEALKSLGYTLEEIQQLTPYALIEDAAEEVLEEMISKIQRTNKGKIIETYAVRKDHSKFPVQIHLQQIEEHGGHKTFLANVLDITDLKKQEQQKELSLFIQNTFSEQESLQRSLSLILEQICRTSEISAAQIWTKSFEKAHYQQSANWGFDQIPSLPDGEKLLNLALEKRETVFIQNIEDFGAQQVNFTSAMAMPILLDKEIKAVLLVFSKKLEKDPNSFLYLSDMVQNSLAYNIKRKTTETELAKIFDLTPELLLVVSVDGYMRKVNQSFHKILGYSEEELKTLRYKEIVHTDDLEILKDWEKAVLNQKRVTHHKSRIKDSNGEYKWFAWSTAPFMEEGLALVVGKDITEENKRIEAIELQNKKLAEIAWEQSHVVRAPLARMMGCIHHLENSDEHSTMLLKKVKDSAYELDQIIKTIVSKAEHIKNV